MMSRSIVLGILAASCITAAAGGAYLAVRQNATHAAVPNQPASPAVAETETVIAPGAPAPVEARESPAMEAKPPAVEPGERETARADTRPATVKPRPREPVSAAKPRSRPAPSSAPPLAVEPLARAPVGETVTLPEPPAVRPIDAPPARPVPEFVEVVVPSSSVLGLRVETSLSSERSQVEDTVQARVTRDVTADGRIAIPAGSRVLGSVTQVERGGKLKERARLGVRFHTLVLADGAQIPIRTESIFREGESPGGESARKIGGAAIGGAILGALIGGGKGAAIGGATGAAGGTAVVMAGDRNAATLPAGTVLSVRLSEPVTLDVERH
jgi:hypothetical protein